MKTQRETKLQELYNGVSERIRDRRLKKNMTQLDLAVAVGCTQDYISRIESGDINLTLEYFYKLSNSLGVTVGYFFK